MNVSLTPVLEKWIQSKVRSGLYGSSSEVVRDALRLLHQFETQRAAKLDELRAELQVGLEQAKAGQVKKTRRFAPGRDQAPRPGAPRP